MIRTGRRSYLIASASVFAAMYSVLGLVPISPLIGIPSFLSLREILAPIAGMLFGPLVGGYSMILGAFVDIGLGRPVVFDFLDFVPDLAAALTAGFCFTGRRREAVGFPILLIAIFSLDPLSAAFIDVKGVEVPFAWMHVLSVIVLGGALFLEARGRLARLSPAFVFAAVFASTMCSHIAGSIVYENVLVRVNHVLTPQALPAIWAAIFAAYPLERVFFTVVGTIVALPVLRSLSRRRREPTVASR